MEVLDLTAENPTPTPSPESPANIPARPLALILSLVAGSALILLSFAFFQRFLGPSGSLVVKTALAGAKLTIAGAVVGATPYQGELRPGEYQITLTDDERKFVAWVGRVRIEPGTTAVIDRDLGPSPALSGGATLTLERGNGLSVDSRPQGAAVSLDGTSIGSTPYSRPSPGPGVHKLKISQSGYLDQEIEINVTAGWRMKVTVDLYKNPASQVSFIEETVITPTSVQDLKILLPREELGLDKITSQSANPSYAPWTKAAFYDLGSDDQDLTSSVTTWIKGLYLYAVGILKISDLPFHYLIDAQGNIYEGRSGGRDITSLDVAGGLAAIPQAPVLKPGLAQVGYLGPLGGPTAAAKASFKSLLSWLGTPPFAEAKPLQAQALTMAAGAEEDLSLEYKNTGWATWNNLASDQVLLTVAAGSVFYHPIWIDTTHPAKSTAVYTPRNGVASFSFKITAPKYGGDYDQSFSLTRTGQTVAGSLTTIKIHVDGPAKPTQQLKIKSTSVGFLRVRSGPGSSYSEIAQVKPGETYEWVIEQSGWIQIRIADGRLGWVSSTYIVKI